MGLQRWRDGGSRRGPVWWPARYRPAGDDRGDWTVRLPVEVLRQASQPLVVYGSVTTVPYYESSTANTTINTTAWNWTRATPPLL